MGGSLYIQTLYIVPLSVVSLYTRDTHVHVQVHVPVYTGVQCIEVSYCKWTGDSSGKYSVADTSSTELSALPLPADMTAMQIDC